MKIIYNDGHVAECPVEEELHVIRHTCAHVMAQAIKRLYPNADFAYGPATEKGFYYDVDLGDVKLSDEDLLSIEKEMKKIIKENLPIRPFILPREEAIKLMQERGENIRSNTSATFRKTPSSASISKANTSICASGRTFATPRP